MHQRLYHAGHFQFQQVILAAVLIISGIMVILAVCCTCASTLVREDGREIGFRQSHANEHAVNDDPTELAVPLPQCAE